jgi:hypothetical protein
MHSRTWLATVLALLATVGGSLLASASNAPAAQSDGLRALDGEWIYVEDRTEGRPLEQLGPPMSSTFSLRAEVGAVVLTRGHGSGHKDVRVALDGKVTEVVEGKKTTRYRGAWKDGVFTYEVDFVEESGTDPDRLIRRKFQVTPEGLILRASRGSSDSSESVALYRHAEDIPMPAPAKAAVSDMAWLAGAWVGTRGSGGTTSIEERWSPPLGGAMLAVSRTVSRGKMSAFEYLRIVERDGGLVYIAQPGGAAPTEFVLSELGTNRAVFDNPRHDYPKRIVYELSAEGNLTATIGFLKGGTPRRFEFKREGE